MAKDKYDKPSRTLRKCDKGSDVRGLEDGANKVMKQFDLGRRIEKDSKLQAGDFNIISLAAQFVGCPTEDQKKIDKKDNSNKRVTERAQNLIRYPEKRSKKQKEKGEKAAKKFKQDIGKEEVKAKDLGPNSQISPNFKVSDFDCHNGERVPKAAYEGLIKLVTGYLQPLRDASGGPVSINSGYRPPSYNASIGGASNSQHLYSHNTPGSESVAADVVSSKWSVEKVHSFMDDLNIGGLGRYSTFCHCDNRPTKARWNG